MRDPLLQISRQKASTAATGLVIAFALVLL